MTSPAGTARRVLYALLAVAALAPARAFSQALSEPDETFVSGKDVVVYPSDPASSVFRFLPDGQSIPFDRSLVLSAAPGETRAYLLRSSANQATLDSAPVSGYVIDKTRPGAPRAEPGTGLYSVAQRPALSAEDGADIFWALVGPAGAASSFARYGEDSRPTLSPPTSGTLTYTLLAYAVDQAGNRGYPARYVFRLAEPGLPAAAPQPDSWAISPDATIPKPDLDPGRGFTEIRMAIPPEATLLLDVDPDSPPQSLDDFERIAPEGGLARLRLPCPYGWSDDLSIYYGILRDGVATYNPAPLIVRIVNPADEVPLPAAPEAPILVADPAGRGAFAVFPSYDGSLFASVDGASSVPYSAPIALPGAKRSVKVSWYGQDDSGQRSVDRSITFTLPEALPDVELAGVAEGAILGGDVTLKPKAKATLRYEIRLDGSLPPEPGTASPLLGDALALTCPPGEERAIVLRYRPFSGDSGGEGRIIRFTLDRKPPEAPHPTEAPSAYSDKPASLSLATGLGGKDVFASVSVDGAAGPFAPVTAPLSFAGSDLGPVSYIVRAYGVDAAGNRSAEMKSLSFVVDRSTVYVAEDGSDRGDGTPDRPYKSLDLALSIAVRSGKRSVHIRGALDMRAPIRSSSDIALLGGFDAKWSKDSAARAVVRVAMPRGGTAFSQAGGTLLLRRLDISSDAAGPGPLFAVSGATLSLDDSSVSAGTEGDLLLVSAQKSRIYVNGSRIAASRAMACTAFSSDASDIAVSNSSVACAAGVRIFGAFDMDGGGLSLRESLLESRADLGLNLLSLRSSSLLVDRCLITAESGSGFLRLGSLKAVRGEVKNSKVLVSWKGPGTLFEISGGGPAFRHDTIVAGSEKGGLRFFDWRGEAPQLWNSIFECSGAGSELLRSDSVPGPGAIVADCVWGFDLLLSGALQTADLASLNALNAGSVLYSSKPIVSEPPERTFSAPLKSQAPLRTGSACVDGALPLESGYETDFSGHRRPGPGKASPDIGADELVG